MNLIEKKFRDGTSRKDRGSVELDANYISIEERSVRDLLKFVLRFAERLKFYNHVNQPDGNWKLFFGGDSLPGQARVESGLTETEQVYLDEMAEYLQNPGKYAGDAQKLGFYSAPHRTLLLTCIKLLEYARQQFADLTGRHLDHYYRTVLQFREKQAVPDRVNLVFKLADNEAEYLLARHTLLDGGTDSSGNPRRYALDDDILLNRVQVARVNTLQVRRKLIDLRSVHNSGNETDPEVKSDHDFFEMLKWGLGYPGQGDDLPRYPRNDPTANDIAVNLAGLNGLYGKLKGLDYATAMDTYSDEFNYVMEQLHFDLLEDFSYVMELNERQKDANPVNNPTDAEWQQAYDYIERAFIKSRIRNRQATLRKVYEKPGTGGSISLFRFAFGIGQNNQLPVFAYQPDDQGLSALMNIYFLLKNSRPGQVGYDNAWDYVNRKLYMSTEDYLFVIDTGRSVTNHEAQAWERVYEIVEQAQTARENYSPSIKRVLVERLVPRVVYARDNIDFPASFSPLGETDQGLAGVEVDTESHFLGFAVSSPLLVLKEGKRVINMSITFNRQLDEETLDALTGGLAIGFSGGPDMPWFDAEHGDISIVSSNAANSQTLKLQITLGESAPALIAPEIDSLAFSPVQPVTSPYPVIRLSVKDIIQDSGAGNGLYYLKLKDLQLQQLRLDVNVGDGIGAGLKSLALRNDGNVLSSNGTLAPFGHNPHRLAGFYIANDEISRKQLTSITFHMEWVNLPDSFSSTSGHYQGYKDINGVVIGVDDDDFKVKLNVFDKRMLGSVALASLFTRETITEPGDTGDTGDTRIRLKPVSGLKYEFDPQTSGYANIDLAHTESSDPLDWERYFKLELNGAHSTFLQDVYQAALQNLEAGQKINQPYNPQIRRVTVDYACAGTVDFTASDPASAPIQVLQIHPFGQVDLLKTDQLTDKNGEPVGYHLLPQYNDDGHLYIGLENLEDKQETALLFQMAAGTENSDLELPRVDWRYLADDGWEEFRDDGILSDTTGGMLDTGIIRFQPPSSLDATGEHPRASASNRLMPNGLHWFEARVPDNSPAIPKAIALFSQAALATRVMQSPGADYANDTAPAGTVIKPVTPIAAIDSITQPYSSFGGKAREDNGQFVKRVSERLRHKGRAVSMWDYERLVLEQFPEIYKVKCLNQAARENDPAAAKVTLVVIPNLVNRTPFFPLQPKVSQKLRSRIADYLQDKVSPFVDFDVVNPRYEEIRYRVTLTFREKENEGLYIRQLNQDIINYLSPWAYDSQADVTFGGAIHRSSLIHFIKNLSYVDYIGSLELVDHVLIGQDANGLASRQLLTPLAQDAVATRFPDSILVSSPDHYIDLISEQYEAIQFSGIGYMAVGVDFIVT